MYPSVYMRTFATEMGVDGRPSCRSWFYSLTFASFQLGIAVWGVFREDPLSGSLMAMGLSQLWKIMVLPVNSGGKLNPQPKLGTLQSWDMWKAEPGFHVGRLQGVQDRPQNAIILIVYRDAQLRAV